MTNESGRGTSRIAKSGQPAPGNGAPRPTGSQPVKPVTQKIAPAGQQPGTQRVQQQTGTQRIAQGSTQKMPAGGTSPAPQTSRITKPASTSQQKPATQKVAAAGRETASLKKTTTGRVTTSSPAATTGRRSVSGRAQAAPKGLSKKHKLIFAGALGAIVLLGGLFWIIKSGQINPEDVKKRMAGELAKLEKIPEDKPIELDQAMHVLLEDEQFKQFAIKEMKSLANVHKTVHDRALSEKRAGIETKPFFAKVESERAKSDYDVNKANELYDESSSLWGLFETTTYKDELTRVRELLKADIEKGAVGNWVTDWNMKWKSDIGKMRAAGDFAGGLKKITEFETQYKLRDDSQWTKVSDDEKAKAKREADKFVQKLETEAAKAVEEGKTKADARKPLDAAKTGLAGYDVALKKLNEILEKY